MNTGEKTMKLLHIDSSALGANSVSRELTRRIVAQWQAAHPGTTVEHLDLAADAPTHLSAESLGFRLGPKAESLTDVQRKENEISERLVSQFLAADVVVVGAPMYNFSVPSQLKAWIDRVAQAGRTFTYTDKGPKGLAAGKTVIVASSRGGMYSTNPALASLDHQESYLKTVFGFFGITDVRFVRAEGVAMGEAAKAKALEAANDVISGISALEDEEYAVAA
jgi:FMN-dependent NADH-azoreductase